MNLLTRLFARQLSLKGHHKRKAASRKLYRETHDQLREKLGMEPIRWGKG
jgi:hypothetical protein